MNWTTSTAFHKNPIIPDYIETIQQTKVYAIIFDAGSTGTRIHVYKFRYSQNDTFPYVLVDELYEEVKPGLSSYANNPKNIRHGLLHLLQCAKRKIPKVLWNRTWMTLKATAGLRLLPNNEVQDILYEVEMILRDSGFRLMPNGVSVMSGLDEGILSWVTVNFLLQRVRQPHQSFGTIDLGGGSLQITFIPSLSNNSNSSSSNNDSNIRSSFIHTMKLGKSNSSIYSHSYLGLGLMSARYSILTNFTSLQPLPTSSLHQHNNISSLCVPHGYQGHWKFGNVRYSISSRASYNVSLFDECYKQSQYLVTKYIQVHSSKDMMIKRQFYVFSYFYDRVKDAIDHLQSDIFTNKQITPAMYGLLARNACSANNKYSHRKPFLCLDLTYIYALLKDGFKFKDSTILYLTKTINNIELGWALGAVFDLLHWSEKV